MSGHEDTAQLHYISSSSFPTLGLLTLSGMVPDLSPYYIPVGFPYKRKSIYLDPPYETKSFSRLTRVDLQNFTTKFVPQLCALTSGSDRILIPREAAPGLNQPLSETQNGSRISLDPLRISSDPLLIDGDWTLPTSNTISTTCYTIHKRTKKTHHGQHKTTNLAGNHTQSEIVLEEVTHTTLRR